MKVLWKHIHTYTLEFTNIFTHWSLDYLGLLRFLLYQNLTQIEMAHCSQINKLISLFDEKTTIPHLRDCSPHTYLEKISMRTPLNFEYFMRLCTTIQTQSTKEHVYMNFHNETPLFNVDSSAISSRSP